MSVTIDRDALVETLLSMTDEQYTLPFIYSTMLRSTEISGGASIGQIASVWIQLKSGMDDRDVLGIIDACVACLLYAQLLRIRERGDRRVTEDMIESMRTVIHRHWLRATEEDLEPDSVVDSALLINNYVSS